MGWNYQLDYFVGSTLLKADMATFLSDYNKTSPLKRINHLAI